MLKLKNKFCNIAYSQILQLFAVKNMTKSYGLGFSITYFLLFIFEE